MLIDGVENTDYLSAMFNPPKVYCRCGCGHRVRNIKRMGRPKVYIDAAHQQRHYREKMRKLIESAKQALARAG